MPTRAMVVFSLLLLTGCSRQELQTGLTEGEAQEVIVLLKDHGLEASRQISISADQGPPTWTVSVKGGSKNLFLAWKILQENGLPREKATGLKDVFSSSSLIPTASEEKARMIVGLSGEIRQTLLSVSGIVDARVHVVLPENSPLIEKSEWKPATASVLVKYQGQQLPLQPEDVKSLVANGIEGLQPPNVAVVFKKVESTPPPPTEAGSWYFGSRDLTVFSLGLLILTTLGSLALLIRSHRLQAKLRQLQNELRAVSAQQQLKS
jgi:type III secretion protein J